MHLSGFPWWLSGKEPACQCKRCGFDPWVGKIPQRRKWPPTLVFWPGKSQRSLAGYSSYGRKSIGHNFATKPQQRIHLLMISRNEKNYCDLRVHVFGEVRSHFVQADMRHQAQDYVNVPHPPQAHRTTAQDKYFSYQKL